MLWFIKFSHRTTFYFTSLRHRPTRLIRCVSTTIVVVTTMRKLFETISELEGYKQKFGLVGVDQCEKEWKTVKIEQGRVVLLLSWLWPRMRRKTEVNVVVRVTRAVSVAVAAHFKCVRYTFTH